MTVLLGRAGVVDAGDVSASIAALVAGTALRRQSGRNTEEAEAQMLTKAIRDIVAAHVLGPDVVDRAIAGLGTSAA
jgi:hypothetical protein